MAVSKNGQSPLTSGYRRELTGERHVQLNQGITEDALAGLSLSHGKAISASHFGAIGDGVNNDSAAIQAALDYAAAQGGGRVILAPGVYVCDNLTVDSFVHFDMSGAELLSTVGATGFMVSNETADSRGWSVSNGRINCRGYGVYGVLVDQDGGSWGVGYADPEVYLANLRVENSAVDAYRLVGARVTHCFRCRARSCTGDGFALLAGATDSTNDCLFVQCSASSARDLIHAEVGSNTWVGFKGGEATRYGIYLGTDGINSNFSGCIIDHCATANYWIEGSHNSFSSCGNQSGPTGAPAIVFVSPSSDNTFLGWVWGNGSDPNYAVKVPASCVGNVITLGVTGTATGLVDPTSDLLNNRVTVNAKYDGEMLNQDIALAAGVTTGSATLANTNLSFTVAAGRTYHFRAVLHVAPNATGGHKYAIAGTCTATAIVYTILSHNNTPAVVLSSQQTALGGLAGAAGGSTVITVIEGAITVNAGGTLVVQFAQNAANGTSLLRRGSSFHLRPVKPV